MAVLKALAYLRLKKIIHTLSLSRGNALVTSLTLLGFLYLIALTIFIGAHLHLWVDEENLFGSLVIFFVFDFSVRFFSQHIPNISMQVLYLPISRKTIAHSICFASLANRLNLFPFALWLPHLLFSVTNALPWIFVLVSFTVCSNYVNLLLQNQSGVRVKIAIYLAFLIAASVVAANDFLSPKAGDEFARLDLKLTLMLGWLFSGCAYFLSYLRILQKLNLDSFDKQEVKSGLLFQRVFDLSTSMISDQLLVLELRLLTRNRRPLTYVLLSVLWACYLAYTVMPDFPADSLWFLLTATTATASTLLFYCQYIFSWESEYFEYLLLHTHPKEYILSKRSALNILLAVNAFLLMPLITFSFTDLPIISLLLYHFGVSIPVIICLSMWNTKRLSLGRGSFLNYEGSTLATFMVIIFLIASPLAIWLVLSVLNIEENIFNVMLALGFAGLVARHFLNGLAVDLFQKRRWQMFAEFQIRD